MELTPFEFTPEQKDFHEALSHKTGECVSALIAKALEGLQEGERPSRMHGNTDGGDEKESPQKEAQKPIWELFADAFKDVPEEEFNRLPIDGAAQHDHYIYGMPKPPT